MKPLQILNMSVWKKLAKLVTPMLLLLKVDKYLIQKATGRSTWHYLVLPTWSITEEQPATPAEHPAVALCFRTRVDAEYAYEKYGDVKADIFFPYWRPRLRRF